MPRHLKRGMDASAIKAADAKVRETVESILAEIETRRDAAVRDLSQKFDNWSPANFKLSTQPPKAKKRSMMPAFNSAVKLRSSAAQKKALCVSSD